MEIGTALVPRPAMEKGKTLPGEKLQNGSPPRRTLGVKRNGPEALFRATELREVVRAELALRDEAGLPRREPPCEPDEPDARPEEPDPGAKPPAEPAAVAVSAAAMTAVMASVGFMKWPDNGI